MNRYRQMKDSQSIFEVCVTMIAILATVIVLVSFFADAIDKSMDNQQAALDRHLSPAKRAAISGDNK